MVRLLARASHDRRYSKGGVQGRYAKAGAGKEDRCQRPVRHRRPDRGVPRRLRASRPLIRRDLPFCRRGQPARIRRSSRNGHGKYVEASAKYLREGVLDVQTIVSVEPDNLGHGVDLRIRIAKITLLFRFIRFLGSRMRCIRIPHSIRGAENAYYEQYVSCAIHGNVPFSCWI